MKILIVVFGLLAWIGCHEDPEIVKSDVYETEAVWTNMIASDGCAWHFSVVQGDSLINFAASDGSQKVIEKALGKVESAYSFPKVHIKYSATGRKKDVQCGWGVTTQYNEIDVLDMRKTE